MIVSGSKTSSETAPVEVVRDFPARSIVSLRQERIRQIPHDFHNHYLSCANESLRTRLTLRKEGEVALLESPNRLGATTPLSGG